MAILIGCIFSLVFYFLFIPVVTQKEGRDYYLRPGLSKHAAIAELAEQGVIRHPRILTLFTFYQKNALKMGEYHFINGSSLHSIWQQITTGSGLLYRRFTIIPGWTFKQLREALNQAPALRHLTLAMTDTEIMQNLGQANLAAEGEFFPETYNYTKGASDLNLLKRAFNLMQSKLQKISQNLLPSLPYKDSYQVLIAASLIEKEAYKDLERPKVAGVLVNRLKKNMLLQIDATVIYGLGNRYTGKIYKENLLQDTPYNSYMHKGLPPTPIAMPGYASLQAAAQPEKNDFYYYVAKGDGSHQFSITLEDHHQAVKTFSKPQNSVLPNSLRP